MRRATVALATANVLAVTLGGAALVTALDARAQLADLGDRLAAVETDADRGTEADTSSDPAVTELRADLEEVRGVLQLTLEELSEQQEASEGTAPAVDPFAATKLADLEQEVGDLSASVARLCEEATGSSFC